MQWICLQIQRVPLSLCLRTPQFLMVRKYVFLMELWTHYVCAVLFAMCMCACVFAMIEMLVIMSATVFHVSVVRQLSPWNVVSSSLSPRIYFMGHYPLSLIHVTVEQKSSFHTLLTLALFIHFSWRQIVTESACYLKEKNYCRSRSSHSSLKWPFCPHSTHIFWGTTPGFGNSCPQTNAAISRLS